MAAFTKVNSFTQALAEKKHNLSSDQLAVALTNVSVSAGMSVLADVTQISYTNLSTRNITRTSAGSTAGVYKLTLTDLVLTASGAVGPFQHVVIFNDTAAADELLGFSSYATSIALATGESFTINFDDAAGALTI